MNKMKLLPLLFLLSLCACLLAGCGSGETETSAPAPETTSAAAGASAEAVPASAETAPEEGELVYTASFRSIPLNLENYPSFLGYSAEGAYVGTYEVIEEGKIPEGVVPEYEGQFDTYGQRIYFYAQNGERKQLDYVSDTGEENSEGKKDYDSGSSIEKIFPTDDGQLVLLEQIYVSWWDGPADMTETDPDYWNYSKYENHYRILRLDGEGKPISSVPLDWEPRENEWLSFNEAVMDDQGRILVCGQQNVYLFSSDGSLAAEIELDGWANGVLVLRDGQLAVSASGMGGPALSLLDEEKKSVSEKVKLDTWPEKCFKGSGDYDFYYTSGTKLYGYKLADKAEEELVNLMDCDLSAGELGWLQGDADGAFSCYCRSEKELTVAELRLVPRSTVPEKRVLTLGTLGGMGVEDAVLRFNKRHNDVRIRVVDYSETFSEGESDMDGVTRLSTEIMAGGMPDLLDLSVMPYEQLAAKGLLEDLYPWIDADPDLSREDFLPNVLRAMERGGKLYQICSGFQISTLLGASSVVGEEPGWGFEELNRALASMPEGSSVFGPYYSREQVMQECVMADLGSYVDWEKASCDFENEDFYALLAFCASFPEEPDYSGDEESEMSLISSGRQMLMERYISDLQDLGYVDQFFGGKVTYIGYPVRSGSGSLLILNNAIGMSSSCADKEAAWDFLREFLLPAYQMDQYNLPVRQDVFQVQLEDAMRIEYLTNEQGQYVLDENGERIPVSRGGMGMADESGNMFSFEYYGLTEEQAQRFLHMLEMTDVTPGVYTTIYGIIRNEAEMYFAGQHSAEESAKIIQTKVSLYLSEQN